MKDSATRFLMVWFVACGMGCAGSDTGAVIVAQDEVQEGDEQSVASQDVADLGNWPTETWTVETPESQEMDSQKLELARDYAFADGRNTQSVVIVRGGVIVGEWYASGSDKDDHVTSWSVGKSILSAVVGIAIERGDLPGIDEPVVSFFPEWEGTGRDAITLRHALQMRSGLVPSTESLYVQVDQLEYSLEREIAVDPGTTWAYQNEDSMLVSGALERSTGKPLAEYANEVLFEPLGMNGLWWLDFMGNTLGYCCIDATARDFARFGLLFARLGEWQGNQLVPKAWYEESVASSHWDMPYGLHWWTFDNRFYGANFAAFGHMDQLIWIFPEHDLVVLRNGTYIRHGSEARVAFGSYQETLEADDWDDANFVGLVLDALLPQE